MGMAAKSFLSFEKKIGKITLIVKNIFQFIFLNLGDLRKLNV